MGIFRIVFLGAVAAAMHLFASAAHAEDAYPTRPVHIVVPFAPGGGTDLITRSLAEIIAAQWKASVVIENKPGGGTTIATLAALAAPPDGYTLLAYSNSLLIAPLLMPSTPYNWERDFTGVSLFAISPHVLVVHPSVPARTLDEFVAWVKSQSGKATYASFGNGSSNHLGFETLKRKLGIDITHIPYKGSAPALNDLVAGHVNAMLGDLQGLSQLIEAGSLRPIAVAHTHRLASLPNVPTLSEVGVSGFASSSIFGVVARKETPPPIVAQWSQAFAEVLKQPEVKKRFEGLGLELIGASPEATQTFLREEAAKSAEAVAVSGAKAE